MINKNDEDIDSHQNLNLYECHEIINLPQLLLNLFLLRNFVSCWMSLQIKRLNNQRDFVLFHNIML